MLFKSFVVTAVLATFTSVRGAPAASSSLIPSSSIPQPPPVPTVTNAPQIASGLKTAASVVDRLDQLLKPNGVLLTGDELRQLTVFDFNNQVPGPGGSILLATVDEFPILEGLGISAGVSFIKACGINIPHSHPRASEVLTVVEGILYTGFVQENGFNTEIETQLGTFQGTVFPMGSIHYQYNPTCSPAAFVAALGSDDPGRSDIATYGTYTVK
ncbi:RmlC-like cupin domain-containing protein [Roridomyces roridus]|uniref:RmlC-like cupin domain-containing protein n=1 Tax=Roridomyces roridus TaxID=1738132 RepID=A0AAD7B436_9AGAR|nr:RmlC-like cupin domain-containing protein [Roridomyces roridus]